MEKERPVKSGEKKSEPKPKHKKPYSKPSFQFERVFETQALSCGKIGQHQPQCHFNRKNS